MPFRNKSKLISLFLTININSISKSETRLLCGTLTYVLEQIFLNSCFNELPIFWPAILSVHLCYVLGTVNYRKTTWALKKICSLAVFSEPYASSVVVYLEQRRKKHLQSTRMSFDLALIWESPHTNYKLQKNNSSPGRSNLSVGFMGSQHG